MDLIIFEELLREGCFQQTKPKLTPYKAYRK